MFNRLRLSVFACCLMATAVRAEHVEESHVRGERLNLLGAFVGGAYLEGDDYFTYGLEYHRIIKLPFGVSFLAERIPNNFYGRSETELFTLATLNFMKNLYVGIGPGVKFERDERDLLIGRISIGRIIHIKPDIEIFPNLDLDRTEGESPKFVFGVTFGKQF